MRNWETIWPLKSSDRGRDSHDRRLDCEGCFIEAIGQGETELEFQIEKTYARRRLMRGSAGMGNVESMQGSGFVMKNRASEDHVWMR